MDDYLISLVPLLVFLACVLFLGGIYLLWSASQVSGAEKIKQRIRRLSAAAAEEAEAQKFVTLARQQGMTAFDAALLRLPRLHNLDRFLEQSGVNFGPAYFAILCFISIICGAIIMSLVFRSINVLPLLLGAALGLVIPLWVLSRIRRNRIDRLVKQIPDALNFFARSLRAGNPFSGAIKSAAEELPEPIAGELLMTFDELNYGLPFEESMHNLAARVDAEEVRLFVTAVLVQKSTGGNLAELLNKIAKLIRDRMTAKNEIKIQAAEMRTSAQILIALPFVVAGLLQVVNPGYLGVMLESSMGRTIILVQIGLMCVGYWIMNRMVSFRV